jgi:oligopeptide transport system substrate-binding protein
MRSKLLVLASLLILASMVLSACQPSATPTPEVIIQTQIVEGQPQEVVVTATPSADQPAAAAPYLRVNLGTYPDTIDPQKSSFVNEIAHLKLIYEGLTRLDNDLNTVPGAAESWEYNDDATQLTFHLREGLKYSDGSLLNAKRFEYSLMRNIDPATAGEYASITDDIAAQPTAHRRCDRPERRRISRSARRRPGPRCGFTGAACTDYEQTDCLDLVIGLAQPAPYFHTVASLWVTYPAKEELISEGGEIWWNSSKFQVGNGPFVLSALEPFVRAYFTPNANYWRGVATMTLEIPISPIRR